MPQRRRWTSRGCRRRRRREEPRPLLDRQRAEQAAVAHDRLEHVGDRLHGQEFLITPWNTALIIADTIRTANLTSIGGPADQKVVDSIVQEIDISTGKVLFQWNAAAHVRYQDSEQPRPASAATPWDWFYINAIHLDTDGNLLISARYAWGVQQARSARPAQSCGGSGGSSTTSSSAPVCSSCTSTTRARIPDGTIMLYDDGPGTRSTSRGGSDRAQHGRPPRGAAGRQLDPQPITVVAMGNSRNSDGQRRRRLVWRRS